MSRNISILFFVFLVLNTACGAKRALRYYHEGRRAAQDGKLKVAESKYKRALGIRKNFTDARLGLAILYDREGKKDLSLIEARKAEQRDPNNPIVHYNLAAFYEPVNRRVAAIHYQKYLSIEEKKNPKSPWVRHAKRRLKTLKELGYMDPIKGDSFLPTPPEFFPEKYRKKK